MYRNSKIMCVWSKFIYFTSTKVEIYVLFNQIHAPTKGLKGQLDLILQLRFKSHRPNFSNKYNITTKKNNFTLPFIVFKFPQFFHYLKNDINIISYVKSTTSIDR